MNQFIEVTPAAREPKDRMMVNVTHIVSIDTNRNNRGQGAVIYFGGMTAGGGLLDAVDHIVVTESYEEIRDAVGRLREAT